MPLAKLHTAIYLMSMNYYLIKNKGREFADVISLPNEGWKEIAACLVYRDKKLGLPFVFDDENERLDSRTALGAEALAEMEKIEYFREISRDEYYSYVEDRCRAITELYQSENLYFSGTLPDDWYDLCNEKFCNNRLIDDLAWTDDLEKYVEGEMKTYLEIDLYFWNNLLCIDQAWYRDVMSRHLYAIASES